MRREILRTATRVHGVAVHRQRVRRLVEVIAPRLPDSARVLDVGSGDGAVGLLLQRARPDLRVIGLDVRVRPGAAIETLPFDGRRIPFADETFDAVLLVDVLHHAEDAEALLGEAARVARDRIVIKDHDRTGIGAFATLRIMDWVGNRGHGVDLRYRYLAEEEWHRLFERLGLRVDLWDRRLRLYPWPFRWIFDRSLHFVAVLRLARDG